MIDTGSVSIPGDFFGNEYAYAQLTYVYALHVDGVPFYVGSSTNPTSRYITHLAGKCKDSCKRIAELREQGKTPTMRLLDLTDRDHRLFIEAYWIDRLITKGYGLTNTSKYLGKLDKVKDCPTCYRSLSQNTLKPQPKPVQDAAQNVATTITKAIRPKNPMTWHLWAGNGSGDSRKGENV